MGDYQKHEINEPTAGEIEPEEKPAEAQAEAEQPQVEEQPQAERPEWLPEKFDSAEDMAKAYGELEKKMSGGEEQVEEQPQQQEEPEEEEKAPEVTAEAQQRIQEATKEYYENGGEIGDATYEALEKVGISRDLVDRFKAGQEALETAEINLIQGEANGEYDAMAEWAGKNLSDTEFNAFNEVINTGSVEQAKLAVSGMFARYKSEVGGGPKLVTGGTTGSSVMPYQSNQEVVRAMQDPRYKSGDKAYHNEVERRLAVSNF
jgi:hypothetical protein